MAFLSFINEIRRSIEHFIQENRDVKIKDIVISGTELNNFDVFLSERTNYNVSRLSINKEIINIDVKNFDESDINDYMLAVGMALREG